MASTIPAECRDLVDRVAELARTRFAPRAAAVDLDAVFPIENYRDLHAAGLLGLTVPKEFGGVGADPLTYAVSAGVLLLIALAASYVPARRAARVDPIAALHAE